MTIGKDDTLRLNPKCLLTELGDGTGVVLDLDTKFYYTLNRTGVIVWKGLAAAPSGAAAAGLAEMLMTEFAVEPDVAEGDVRTLLQTLLDEGLVKR